MQFPATFVQVAEKPPQRTGNFFLDWIYPFHAISSNFHSGGRKPLPLPPHPLLPLLLSPPRNREIFLDWIYPFHAISSNFGFRWQKRTLHLFWLFMRDPACITHVEYSWSPYYKSTLSFLLSKYLL